MANRYEQAGFTLQLLGDHGETAFVRENADGTLREFVTQHNAVKAPMVTDDCVDYGCGPCSATEWWMRPSCSGASPRRRC